MNLNGPPIIIVMALFLIVVAALNLIDIWRNGD